MKVHHVGFLTKNLERSRADFLLLGYSVEKPSAYDHIRKVNIEFLTNGGYRVELIEPCGKDSPLYPLLKRYKNTPYHLCYESADFENDINALSNDGGGGVSYHRPSGNRALLGEPACLFPCGKRERNRRNRGYEVSNYRAAEGVLPL